MKTRSYTGLKLEGEKSLEVNDHLALEQPLTISVNGEAFTITMQTPGNEMDLARGLLFTEGVIRKRNSNPELHAVETSDDGFISKVNVALAENELDKSQLNKRNLLSVASCGICGKTELDIPSGEKLESSEVLNIRYVAQMFDDMSASQAAFIQSGGSHASAAFDSKRRMIVVMEDIGRHNAVDKVIGSLLNSGNIKQAQYLLVSGRVSYEIVTKCFIAGIPFLLAVSAPSSLAVDFSKELGITLVGFCRQDRATVYSHPERLV